MIALRVLLMMTALTGLLYPLAITAVAQLVFPTRANGSRVVKDGKVTGSRWIGQHFDKPGDFWGRPSATGPSPYNAASSSGSNLGPSNPDLTQAIAKRRQTLREADPGNERPIPIDLLTASASGLDPHISPEAAYYQASRVARIRSIPLAEMERLIARHTEPRQLGILGEPVVNVSLLNEALNAARR